MFESIPDYRKIVLLLFLVKSDSDLLNDCRFLKNDVGRVTLKFKIILMEQNEEYLDYTKNLEEPITEGILNK